MKRSRNNSNPILICLLLVFFTAIGCSKKSTDTEIIYPAWQGTYIGDAYGSTHTLSGSVTYWYGETTKLWVTGSLPDSFLTVHLQFQKHDPSGQLRFYDYYWNGIIHGSEIRIAGIYIDDDDKKHELSLSRRTNPEIISGSYKRFKLMTDSSYFLEASISFRVE